MKPYPPTMREKRRHISFRIISDEKHGKKEVIKALWDNAFEYIGAVGAAESAFWVVDFDEASQEGVVRCSNVSADRILALLAFLNKVSNKKASVHIIGVTGTVKKAKTLSGHEGS